MMTPLGTALAAYWGSMGLMSLFAVLLRRPVGTYLAPRMRFWRNRADAERLYQRSVLAVGTTVLLISVAAFYFEVVVMGRLNAILSAITLRIAATACQQPI